MINSFPFICLRINLIEIARIIRSIQIANCTIF
nr:MAG TPA: hypothetical protein [Caudoviricetes sp.]